MAFTARIFGNKCRALMAAAKSAAAKSTPATTVAAKSIPATTVAAKSTPATAAAKSTPATAAAAESKGRAFGILKVQKVSPALAKFLGTAEASRTDATKKVWAYIKSHNLQNPDNKKEIFCDEKLKAIFPGNDKINFVGVAKLLSSHFPKTS